MAQVIVEMFPAGVQWGGSAHPNGALPVLAGKGGKIEEVTTSGTSAATTIDSENGWFVSVKLEASAAAGVWGIIAPTPVATNGAGFFVAPGERRDLGPLVAGDKLAFLDDS